MRLTEISAQSVRHLRNFSGNDSNDPCGPVARSQTGSAYGSFGSQVPGNSALVPRFATEEGSFDLRTEMVACPAGSYGESTPRVSHRQTSRPVADPERFEPPDNRRPIGACSRESVDVSARSSRSGHDDHNPRHLLFVPGVCGRAIDVELRPAGGEATLDSIIRADHGGNRAARLLLQTCDGDTHRWMIYADLVTNSLTWGRGGAKPGTNLRSDRPVRRTARRSIFAWAAWRSMCPCRATCGSRVRHSPSRPRLRPLRA